MNLARDSGIDSLVHLVANKIDDTDDLAFIRARTGAEPLGALPLLPALKKSRQRGGAVTADMVPAALMQSIEDTARTPAIPESTRMKKLLALHEKLNSKQWVKLAYGDVMGQIDTDFMKGEAA
jgi:CO dehydrogenase maturation factor